MTSDATITTPGERWIVDDPAAITPAWMTDVLRAAGTDTEVAGLRFEPVGTGQTAVSYRFHLDYGPDLAVGDPGRGPASVVVKMAGGSPEVRKRLRRAYRSEVGFYRTLAPRARVQVPRCWSADLSDDGYRFTLVLEDAHPAQAGNQLDGCTTAQAALSLRNLAGLHAPFWNDADVTADASWLPRHDAKDFEFLGKITVSAAATFTDRYRDALGPADVDTLLRAADLVAGWGRHTADRFSLVHGDYRLDNLLFSAGDAEVRAVDWQTVELAFPGRDLAYFLSTALPPAERRAHERALIAAYHQQLAEYGVEDYPVDVCFEDYRRGMLQGPIITMIGAVYASAEPTASSDRMFVSMAVHASAAIRDLEVLDLLA